MKSTSINKPSSTRQIDAFMHELKANHELVPPVPLAPTLAPEHAKGSFDTGDPTTTNLFISGLPATINEELLSSIFGRFGPITSVKIMWPRSEDDKQRTSKRISGFVSFLKRKDAATALEEMNEQCIDGNKIHVYWGKKPVYPQASVTEVGVAAPASESTTVTGQQRRIDVEMPAAALRRGIDEVSRAVARGGDAMEQAILLRRQALGLDLAFIREPSSALGIYYRWRTYAFVMGDSDHSWQESPFQMIPNGPMWYPPSIGQQHGSLKRARLTVCEENTEEAGVDRKRTQGSTGAQIERRRHLDKHGKLLVLTEDEVDDFERLLQGLTVSRRSIKEAMGFAFDHVEGAAELVDILREALVIPSTPIAIKIARLYLINDLLHNSGSAVKNASAFRSLLQSNLPSVFEALNETFRSIKGRMSAKQVEDRVLLLLRTWESWSIFPSSFIFGLEATFRRTEVDISRITAAALRYAQDHSLEEERDNLLRQARFGGVPLITADSSSLALCDVKARLDFVNEFGAAQRTVLTRSNAEVDAVVDVHPPVDERDDDKDVDGEPLEEDADLDGEPLINDNAPVDLEDLDGEPLEEEDLDGIPFNE